MEGLELDKPLPSVSLQAQKFSRKRKRKKEVQTSQPPWAGTNSVGDQVSRGSQADGAPYLEAPMSKQCPHQGPLELGWAPRD